MEQVDQAIRDSSLTEEEERRLEELGTQIDRITDKITEMAGRSSGANEAIYEATMRHLIYEQEILQMEYDGFNENKKDSEYLKENIESLLEDLERIERPEEPFDPDIFKRVVQNGVVLENKSITFNLIFEI